MPQRNVATNFTFEQQRQEINLVAQDHWSFYSSQTTANATFLKVDGTNGFTGANLAVPNAFTINANSGGGTVTIAGNLDVTGTTTTVSSANLEVTDKNILIAKGSTSDAQADGAGITIDSATDITFNFVDAKDALVSSIGLEAATSLKSNTLTVAGLGSIGGGHFTGNFTPSTGSGVEVFAPDANTGQISSFNRGTSTWNPLRIKGASVPIYTGTSNALVGTFNSTGLTMESGKTITGVLATAGQNNITSVGTLTGLTQTGQYNIGTFQNNDGINMGDSGYFQLRSDSRPATGQAISIYSGGTTAGSLKAAIYHNGGASFASGNLFLNFVSDGANVVARNDSTNNPVYEVYKGGLTANDRTARINSDGSASFVETVTIGSGSAAPDDYGLIAYANANSLSNKSAVYARNLADGRNFTGDNAAGATTFELYANGLGNFGAASNSTNNNGVSVGGSNGSLNIYTTRYTTDCFQIVNTSGSGTNVTLKAFGNGRFETGDVSGTLGADLNTAINGHLFVSQCDDNSNGFEIYQKHGVTATRNTFAVYANTGASGAKAAQFLVRGDGKVLPGTDGTQDLGASNARWANIYSADLQLSNEGGANDVDGTWGQYTIQEGEDDLFLINRRSGKKYKFMLQEVQ